MRRCRVLVWAAAAWVAAGAAAAPPTVVRAAPDNADVGVDPALTELVIEFDQPMEARGMSLCGGGENFPEITARPVWRDDHTFTVAVKLKPGWTCSLSVNCPGAHNFQNQMGEPAIAYPITFRTRAEGEQPPARLAEDVAVRSARQLREAIETRYSYYDLRKQGSVDWDALFAEKLPGLAESRTAAQFARRAARMLSAANDPHVTVRVNDVTLSTSNRQAEWNANFQQLLQLFPNSEKVETSHGVMLFDQLDERTGYAMLSTWTMRDSEKQRALAALDRLAERVNKSAKQAGQPPAMIIDVRLNSGGDELIAREFAQRFAVRSATYSRNRTRNPDAQDGWTGPFDRRIETPEGGPAFEGKLAVLIGPACMSSNESFILMMRHACDARLFGENTAGSSGNPQQIDLPCGVRVLLPSWVDMTPDGRVLEGAGIEPDEEVIWRPTRGAKSDPVIDAAADWIKR